MASLPYVIFQFATSPYKELQSLAWAGAILITMTVLIAQHDRALPSRVEDQMT